MHVVPQDRAGGADLKEGADVSLPKAIEVNNYKKTQTLEERRCILQTCPEKQCSCRIRPPQADISQAQNLAKFGRNVIIARLN